MLIYDTESVGWRAICQSYLDFSLKVFGTLTLTHELNFGVSMKRQGKFSLLVMYVLK